MPITKSAVKKMRRDKTRTQANRQKKNSLMTQVKSFRVTPKLDKLPEVFAALDTAAKTHLIPKNRANRLKSRLSRLVSA